MEKKDCYLLHVMYHIRPGKREAFLSALRESGIPDAVRREDGCICYDYYLSQDDPDTVLLLEKWESRAHQQAHLSQPHMAGIRPIREEYVLESELF